MTDELKIGVLIPQSKQYKTMDRDFMRGLKLAVNAKFYVESIGIGADEQVIIEKIQKLNYQEGITIIIGLFGHHNISHVYEYAFNNDILMLASDLGATMPYSLKKTRGVYINSFSLIESAHLLGKYLIKEGHKKIGVSTSYYDCGYGLLSAMETSFEGENYFTGYYITPHIPREQEELHMETTITGNNPDVVFGFYSGVYAAENAGFAAKNRIMHKYPHYVTAFSLTNELLEEHKASPYELHVISPWLNDKSCTFCAAYKKAYNDEASVFSVLGHENGQIIGSVIEKAGPVPSLGKLIEEMDNLDINGPRGTIRFDNSTNRTIFDQYIFKAESDGEDITFKNTGTLKNDGSFMKRITAQEIPPKMGGWQNAYLCH